MSIDLRHIRWFVALAEQLHFRRAAQHLNVSQPPLSNAIRAMEQELGVDLFRRDRRHVELTDQGEILLVKARQVLAAHQQFLTVGHDVAAGMVGLLRLGMTISAPFVAEVSAAISSMRDRFPGVRVETTHIVTASQALSLLSNDQLDVCILRPYKNQRYPDGISHSPLRADRLMLLVHESHPGCVLERVPLSMLMDESLVAYAPTAATLALGQATSELFAFAGVAPQRIQEVKEMSAVFGLVSMNVGYSILPNSLQRLKVDNVKWCEIEAPAEMLLGCTEIAYACRDGGHSVARNFVDLVVGRGQLAQA